MVLYEMIAAIIWIIIIMILNIIIFGGEITICISNPITKIKKLITAIRTLIKKPK